MPGPLGCLITLTTSFAVVIPPASLSDLESVLPGLMTLPPSLWHDAQCISKSALPSGPAAGAGLLPPCSPPLTQAYEKTVKQQKATPSQAFFISALRQEELTF